MLRTLSLIVGPIVQRDLTRCRKRTSRKGHVPRSHTTCSPLPSVGKQALDQLMLCERCLPFCVERTCAPCSIIVLIVLYRKSTGIHLLTYNTEGCVCIEYYPLARETLVLNTHHARYHTMSPGITTSVPVDQKK